MPVRKHLAPSQTAKQPPAKSEFIFEQTLRLNAESASNDENIRLRPDPPQQFRKGEHKLKAEFEPYGVQFWMLE